MNTMSEELNYYAKEEISNSDLGELKMSPRRFMMRKQENIDFYEFLKESDNKIPLTSKDKHIIEGCLTSLKGHVVANKLLFSEPGGKVETVSEKEVYFTQHDVACKSKLDRLVVDHEAKTVTVADLKTTSNLVYGECQKLNTNTGLLFRDWHTTGFLFNCLQYGYYRQLAFYMNAAAAEYPGYKVESFIKEWIEEGNKEIKDLLLEYAHYKEQNNWSIKKGYENAVEY